MSLIEAARELADALVAAGKQIEAVRMEPLESREKAGGAGPVTRADLESDTLLKTRLPQIIPAAWLSEETADSPARLAAERVWIVDPLDGTREFVAGLPEYSVAAALVERGEPLIGAVHSPRTGLTVWAARGAGCFLGTGEPARVKEGNQLLASRSEIAGGEFDSLTTSWEVVPVGSIQLKLALIAAGRGAATVSRGPKHEWDVCAGALLVSEAGGVARAALGEPLAYNQSFPKVPGVLAGAPAAYQRLLAQVQVMGVSRRMDELKR